MHFFLSDKNEQPLDFITATEIYIVSQENENAYLPGMNHIDI